MVLSPYIPFASDRLRKLLNLPINGWDTDKLLLKPNHKINEPEVLFIKIEDKEIKVQKEKLRGR